MRKYNLCTFAICLNVLIFGYAYISYTYNKMNVTIDNFGLSGNTLKKISNSTYESCFLFCARNPFCLRFAFHAETGCRLYKEEFEFEGDDTEDGQGWKSFEMKETIVAGGDLGWMYFVKAEHCLSPWRLYRSSCYYIKQDTVNFNDAQNQCTNLQSHLVKIDDEGENSFAETLVKEEGVRHHWIGLSDDLQEGTWLWHPSLEGPTYTDWSGPQPDGGTGENCAVIYSDGNMWHDYSCNGQFSFICEREL